MLHTLGLRTRETHQRFSVEKVMHASNGFIRLVDGGNDFNFLSGSFQTVHWQFSPRCHILNTDSHPITMLSMARIMSNDCEALGLTSGERKPSQKSHVKFHSRLNILVLKAQPAFPFWLYRCLPS